MGYVVCIGCRCSVVSDVSGKVGKRCQVGFPCFRYVFRVFRVLATQEIYTTVLLMHEKIINVFSLEILVVVEFFLNELQ